MTTKMDPNVPQFTGSPSSLGLDLTVPDPYDYPVTEMETSLLWKYASGESVPTYRAQPHRVNAFHLPTMRRMVAQNTVSDLLGRPVFTFEDAIEHGIALATLWSQEDAAYSAVKVADVVAPAVGGATTADPSKQQRKEMVETARVEWKEAVAMRNAAVQQWDEYVKAKREAYRLAKEAK